MNKRQQKKWLNCCKEFAAMFVHMQKEGMASYDNNMVFTFSPDDPVASSIHPYRSPGTAQLMSDGTFHFVRKPRIKSQSRLIKKLPHGRVSETKDGAVLLTLKVYEYEITEDDVNIGQTIAQEAAEARNDIEEWLRKI